MEKSGTWLGGMGLLAHSPDGQAGDEREEAVAVGMGPDQSFSMLLWRFGLT